MIADDVLVPFLNHLPRDWLSDFDNIEIWFAPGEAVSRTKVDGRELSITIDFKRAIQGANGLSEIFDRSTDVMYCALCLIVVRALYKYNNEVHPERIRNLDPQALVADYVEKSRKEIRRIRERDCPYIV